MNFWIDNKGRIGGNDDGEPFIQNRTPEMFTEYREEQMNTKPDRSANLSQGPAFIFAGCLERRTTDPDYFRRAWDVPEGYVWQPSTEWTGAGWVRPLGGKLS